MKHSPKQTLHLAAKGAVTSANFKLEDWQGPTRVFRFVGWRDDYSAFFVLDEKDGQFVIQPELFRPESSIRFLEAPTSITKIRLLPPPCRPTRAEAELLREMHQLPRGRGYHDAVATYLAEAKTRNIQHPTLPDRWELIYRDALAPKNVPDGTKNQQAIQEELWTAWAKSHGWTLESIMSCKAEFILRHDVDDEAQLARVCYKMEFKTFACVWLVDFHGPAAPQSTADLDQIRELLDARPELVRLTPDEMEARLEMRNGKKQKHRTLIRYYKDVGISLSDWPSLSLADYPALLQARNLRKESQRRGVTRANKKPERPGSRNRS